MLEDILISEQGCHLGRAEAGDSFHFAVSPLHGKLPRVVLSFADSDIIFLVTVASNPPQLLFAGGEILAFV